MFSRKSKYTIVWLLFIYYFGTQVSVKAQTSNVDSLYIDALFEQKNYKAVIDTLIKKQATRELTFRDYYLLSKSYGRTKQYGNGYIIASEMIAKASEKKDTLNLLQAFNSKAEHMMDLHNIEQGVKYCDSIRSFFKEKDSILFMNLCFKCGLFYHYDGQPQKAYETYKKITKKEYRELSLYTNNFSIILEGLGKGNEAITYLKKSLEIDKKRPVNSNPNLSVIYGNIGNIYLQRDDIKLAKVYMDSAYNALNSYTGLRAKRKLFENYYKLYTLEKNSSKAAVFLDSILIVNEELMYTRVEEKIRSIEAADNRENILIKKVAYVDNELVETKDKVLKGTLLLLSLIFLLIIAFFIFKYRNIKSSYKNILITQRLSWTKLNSEYLSNSLGFMQQMIETENPKSISYLSKFSKLLRLILESSRKTLHPLTEEIDAIKYYLQIQQLELGNNFTFDIYIDPIVEEQEFSIPPMLIQPFVELAVENYNSKVIQQPQLKINIAYNNQQLSCMIADNGIGNNDEISRREKKVEVIKKTKELLKIFSKKLNKFSDLIIEDHYIHGTKITLILPYKNEAL